MDLKFILEQFLISLSYKVNNFDLAIFLNFIDESLKYINLFPVCLFVWPTKDLSYMFCYKINLLSCYFISFSLHVEMLPDFKKFEGQKC